MFSFSLKSSTVRLVIFISSLVIATILVFQLVWLTKVYRFEQKEFDHNVVKAVRGLYEDIDESTYKFSPLNQLIENPEPNTYIAKISLPVNYDSVSNYLQYELDDFDVFTDCHLGIFRSDSARYVYTRILKGAGKKMGKEVIIPSSSSRYDHLTLYFPNRTKYLLTQMNFWIITSMIMLLVLILFGASLYYFYRQRSLNETQKDFIHNFTHEFKTPVAVISLAADVLKNPSIVEKPEKLVTYAGIVDYQSAYLHKQIERLLQFAYTDSHQLHLTKELVNLHELIREAIQNLNPLIQEKNVKLELALQATEPRLLADKDYLVIVITNLVDNAIKYSKTPEIVISSKSNAGHISFSVADKGIGIEKKQLKKIFQKFFRARSGETYTAKGFGLGLSFVKKIIAAHNGTIKVASSPGNGSVFTIELPVQ